MSHPESKQSSGVVVLIIAEARRWVSGVGPQFLAKSRVCSVGLTPLPPPSTASVQKGGNQGPIRLKEGGVRRGTSVTDPVTSL